MKENEQKPIVVNMSEGQNTLTILQGDAPKQIDKMPPVKIDITGSIGAPLCWLKKRVGDIDQHKAHIIVNRDKMEIVLTVNEDDPYSIGFVAGHIRTSLIYNTLGINSGKEWQPEQLGNFLKLNRTYFPNKEENRKVVFALKSFTGKVNQDVQRESKENGNRAMVFRQAVESNIPESFKVCIPVFTGEAPVEIEVETYASVDGNDVTISLQSAGAIDVMEDMKVNTIGKILNDIAEIAPEVVIIEQ